MIAVEDCDGSDASFRLFKAGNNTFFCILYSKGIQKPINSISCFTKRALLFFKKCKQLN